MNQKNVSDQETRPVEKPKAAPQAEPPDEKPHPEYRINIYRDWCKSCGICAAFCPRQCLSLDEQGAPVVDHAERCTGCRWCELHCPDFAICVRAVATGEPKREDADGKD